MVVYKKLRFSLENQDRIRTIRTRIGSTESLLVLIVYKHAGGVARWRHDAAEQQHGGGLLGDEATRTSFRLNRTTENPGRTGAASDGRYLPAGLLRTSGPVAVTEQNRGGRRKNTEPGAGVQEVDGAALAVAARGVRFGSVVD